MGLGHSLLQGQEGQNEDWHETLQFVTLHGGTLEGLGENRWFVFIANARVVAVLINEVQRCLCLSCLIAKVKGPFNKRGN